MKKKEVVIKITLTDDDIIDSVQMLVSLAKTLSILQEGNSTNGNA